MKNNIFLLIIITVISCLSIGLLSAQQKNKVLKYNVRVMGLNIGELTVNEYKNNDSLIIEAITNVEVNIVFKYQVKYYQRSIYYNGELLSSHLQTLKNGDVHSDTWLKKDHDKYFLVKKGNTTIIKDKINYSGSLLYFNEPVKTNTIYMEINGEKNIIKPVSDNVYEIIDKNNHQKGKYTYKNGILQKSVVNHSIANIYLERKEE